MKLFPNLELQKKIKASCLDDFNTWVRESVEKIEKTNVVGDVKKLFNLVKRLSNKPKPPPVNLTTDKNSSLLKSPAEVAKTWKNCLLKILPQQRKRRPVLSWSPSLELLIQLLERNLKPSSAN